MWAGKESERKDYLKLLYSLPSTRDKYPLCSTASSECVILCFRRSSRSLLIHPLIPGDELHQQHPPNHIPLPPLALLSPGLFFPLSHQQMLRKPALYAQSEVATITSQHICSFPPSKKKQPLIGVCGFEGVLQSVVKHTNLDPQRCRVLSITKNIPIREDRAPDQRQKFKKGNKTSPKIYLLPPNWFVSLLFVSEPGRWRGATIGAKSLRRKDRNAAADKADWHKKRGHRGAHRGGGREAGRGGHLRCDLRVRIRVVWMEERMISTRLGRAIVRSE